MKKLLLVLIAFPVLAAFGQEENAADKLWKYEGFFSQQLNQVSFTNWAAGGENSFASTSIAVLTANYAKENITWENKLDMAFGLMKTQDSPTRKNEDKIDFLSKVGRKVSDNLSATALLNFKTQFAEGFNYPNDVDVVSRLMAPGYLLVAIGVDYKPVEYLSIFFSPATGKYTFVLDDDLAAVGAFGVEPGKNVRPEFGAMASITFAKDIFENVNLASKIDLFNNLTDSDKSNRKNTDVNWTTRLNMKVNRFITASMGFDLIYDHNIPIVVGETPLGDPITGPRTQFKQLFGIGISYNFKK
jgi:hypothetical protein